MIDDIKDNKEINILLIEDNPADVRLIKEYLNEAKISYNLTVSNRVSDALSRIGKDHDLILADLGLPDSNGLDTLKKLKETGTNIPIVILTGLNNEEIALISLKEGAQDYLVKNIINSRSLSRSIKFTLERKKIEDRKGLLLNVLHLLNSEYEIDKILKSIVNSIKEYTKYDFVSVKINDNYDYPGAILDSFLQDQSKTAKSFLTKGGSLWSDQSYDISNHLSDENKKEFLKYKIFENKYNSFALIPIRSGDNIIGFLELADNKPGIFNEELIEYYEGLTKSLSITINRKIKEKQT